MNSYRIQPSMGSRVAVRLAQLLAVLVVALTAGGGSVLACRSKVDPSQAEGTLDAYGFTEVTTGGWSWQCGRDDWSCTEFVAVSPAGKRVSGAVGCGMVGCGKGCTVRLDQ